jgi:DNA-binding response OmpR family regulator
MEKSQESKKILIADDEEDICLYLKRYLERKKFNVVCAFDGEETKKWIEEECFDYYLLDCNMPNVSGLDLIAQARKRSPTAKIVLISGFPTINDEMVQNLGGDQFINKPIELGVIDKIFQPEQ